MAINKKLIHFLTKTNFLNKLEAGEILDTSIVFIRDAKQIWTHGELYSCPYTEEEINLLFIGSNVKLTGYAETYSPMEILATDTVNQAFGKIEDYLTDIDQLNAVLVDTGDAAFDPIINDYISSTQLANELLKYVTDLKLASKGYITAAQVPNPDLSNYITKVDSKNYTDTAIANLVDSAPETLNTLNELATAISEHQDITNVLDAAISNKADKTEIPTKVSQLEHDIPYIIDDVVVENGLYIYDIDGKFTLPENWNTVNNSKAVGVAILTDDCRFVVAKENVDSSTVRWGGCGTDISTLTNCTDEANAATDFDGVNSTSKIIAAIGNSNDGYRDGTAAGDCAAYTFPNGKTGYLGAVGEWKLARSYKDELNSALELIGGTKMAEGGYWTSTEYSSSHAWSQWFGSFSFLDYTYKYGSGSYVRAFLALEGPKPLKERVSNLELNYFKWSKLELLKNRGSLSLILSVAASPDAIPYTLSINFEYPVESDITINHTYTDPFGSYRGDGTLVCKKGETSASTICYGTEDISDFDFVFNSFSPTEDDVYKYEITFG